MSPDPFFRPGSWAGVVGLAPEVIGSEIEEAIRERSGDLSPISEEVVEEIGDIGDVDETVIVVIGGIDTGDDETLEEKEENADAVRDVTSPVAVTVAAKKPDLTGAGSRRRDGDGATRRLTA